MIYNAYTITIPPIETSTVHFNFSAEAAGVAFSFDFWFFSDRWNVYVTLPDGTIREAVLYANVQNWVGYSDYRLVAMTDKTTIGQTDLQLIQLKLAVLE